MELSGRAVTEITKDLQALKLALIETGPSDLDQVDAKAVAEEISAIRLQLKRLEADRSALQ
jgi:flagellin-like hook-associated protein FlgL